MSESKVSFVVPCYKLGHLLKECVTSILTQSHENIEVLIMDDCSPDNTPEVAASFDDARVRHIRNDPNLGHLRNYNKGIELSTGEYIWLISADDVLRKPYVVEKYLTLMESHEQVGFAFCPGMSLRNGVETGLVAWATIDSPDAILDGRTFLRRLLESNCVLAPSGLVRRKCYEKVGGFPLDLPFAGDWFLWCMFALHFDVAFFAEPMVCYREHAQSMTDGLIADNVRLLSKDEIAVRWRLRERIRQLGDHKLAEHCMDTIVRYFTGSMVSKRWRTARYRMTLGDFESLLSAQGMNEVEHDEIRARVLKAIGPQLYLDPNFEPDVMLYKKALEYNRSNVKLWLKYLIVRSGRFGDMAVQAISRAREMGRRMLAKS
jgi:glycosyltransferase involved in cell wall biosynthesis